MSNRKGTKRKSVGPAPVFLGSTTRSQARQLDEALRASTASTSGTQNPPPERRGQNNQVQPGLAAVAPPGPQPAVEAAGAPPAVDVQVQPGPRVQVAAAAAAPPGHLFRPAAPAEQIQQVGFAPGRAPPVQVQPGPRVQVAAAAAAPPGHLFRPAAPAEQIQQVGFAPGRAPPVRQQRFMPAAPNVPIPGPQVVNRLINMPAPEINFNGEPYIQHIGPNNVPIQHGNMQNLVPNMPNVNPIQQQHVQHVQNQMHHYQPNMQNLAPIHNVNRIIDDNIPIQRQPNMQNLAPNYAMYNIDIGGMQGVGGEIQDGIVNQGQGVNYGQVGQPIVQNVDRPPQQLLSMSAPLGAGISQQIKDKIVGGLYVDFSSLLENDGGGERLVESVSDKVFGLNEMGQLVMKQSPKAAKLLTIHAWSNAFFVFAAIYLKAHPACMQELLKYGDTIRKAAGRFEGGGWREYDRQFRLRQESRNWPWTIIDQELWLFYVAVPIVNKPNFAPRTFQQRSFRAQNSAIAGRAPYAGGSRMRPNGKPRPACFDFNGIGCIRPNCMFRHVCQSCFKGGHTAKQCARKAKQTNTKSG